MGVLTPNVPRRKGGSFTLMFRDPANGDTFVLPAGSIIQDVIAERINRVTGLVAAGGDAGDVINITGVTTIAADFTSTASKRATMTAGAGLAGAADTSFTFAKTDADSDTGFNVYVICQKYRMGPLT